VLPLSELDKQDIAGYQLIVLSDGHLVSAHKNNSELELMKSTNIPMIGICYGFQL
jgi:GMP synthase-like glutamine amidotransferase